MQIMKGTGDTIFYTNDSHNWIFFLGEKKKAPIINRTISNHKACLDLAFRFFLVKAIV